MLDGMSMDGKLLHVPKTVQLAARITSCPQELDYTGRDAVPYLQSGGSAHLGAHLGFPNHKECNHGMMLSTVKVHQVMMLGDRIYCWLRISAIAPPTSETKTKSSTLPGSGHGGVKARQARSPAQNNSVNSAGQNHRPHSSGSC